MDTSSKREQATKRQFRSLLEKLRIVEEASEPGAFVSAVALRNGVNANVVFGWRRLHRAGLLVKQRDVTPALLPVKLTMPTLTPSERVTLATMKRAKHPAAPISSYLEIVFAGSVSVRLDGEIAPATLTHILEWAARR